MKSIMTEMKRPVYIIKSRINTEEKIIRRQKLTKIIQIEAAEKK